MTKHRLPKLKLVRDGFGPSLNRLLGKSLPPPLWHVDGSSHTFCLALSLSLSYLSVIGNKQPCHGWGGSCRLLHEVM